LAHRLVVCFIDRSLAHKWNAGAAPASSKRQLGRTFGPLIDKPMKCINEIVTHRELPRNC
jgi:hypothetical protein